MNSSAVRPPVAIVAVLVFAPCLAACSGASNLESAYVSCSDDRECPLVTPECRRLSVSGRVFPACTSTCMGGIGAPCYSSTGRDHVTGVCVPTTADGGLDFSGVNRGLPGVCVSVCNPGTSRVCSPLDEQACVPLDGPSVGWNVCIPIGAGRLDAAVPDASMD